MINIHALHYSGSRSFAAAFLLSAALFVSCKEEEILPEAPVVEEPAVAEETSGNRYVNNWILENMQYWYLWSDKLQASTDKNINPEEYFDALLDPSDRFSWIQPNYRELLNSLQGISKEAGYEYVLYREKEGSDNVILQILYIKPGAPAAAAGLKRGDVISKVDGRQLTVQNYKDLLASLKTNHTIEYKALDVEQEKFGEPQTISLSPVEYSENPNYLSKVIEIGGRKIGYFVYNFFASGTEAQPGIYDAGTDAVFAGFQSEGITDLVLDLRFNSGGSEGSAKNLASLIGAGIDQNKIFLKRKYNAQVEKAIIEDRSLGSDYLISKFTSKAANIGSQLSGARVYVLTSSRTASASELIVNALKPFMEVFLIGDKTYGKNVGSISIFEEDDPKNSWGMQPIVVKVFNSRDESDYDAGFTPDVVHKDNGIHLYPLGDPREALLGQAIGQITGAATSSREDRSRRTPVAHSLDLKRRSFNLVMDEKVAPVLTP